jgi:hypothetical protein
MLDTELVNLQDNVIKFNEYVKPQCVSLEACGEMTLDLLVRTCLRATRLLQMIGLSTILK